MITKSLYEKVLGGDYGAVVELKVSIKSILEDYIEYIKEHRGGVIEGRVLKINVNDVVITDEMLNDVLSYLIMKKDKILKYENVFDSMMKYHIRYYIFSC